MSRSSVNCSVICDVAALLTDVSCASDGICPSWRSSGVVTADTIVSALAPGSSVVTDDRRVVDLRQRRDRQLPVADDAGDEHADHQQRRADRPADERLGDVHFGSLRSRAASRRRRRRDPRRCRPPRRRRRPAGARVTRAPGRSWFCPSVTTSSPASSPLPMSASVALDACRSGSASPAPCRRRRPRRRTSPAGRAGPPPPARPARPSCMPSRSRVFTNWLGHSVCAGLGKIAFRRIVAVFWLIWLSTSASVAGAERCAPSRLSASTSGGPRGLALHHARQLVLRQREEHRDRIELRDDDDAGRRRRRAPGCRRRPGGRR